MKIKHCKKVLITLIMLQLFTEIINLIKNIIVIQLFQQYFIEQCQNTNVHVLYSTTDPGQYSVSMSLKS